jgi:hypothetical protein
MSIHTPDSKNPDDQPVNHHQPPFDNTSVHAVLLRIGLTPTAVDAFMGVHLSTPPLLAMPSFLRYLRDLVGDSRTAPDPMFYTRMRFASLLPLDTWDNDLDSETLVTLAIWYKAHDNRLRTFDWERFLDPDAFEVYACTPPQRAFCVVLSPPCAPADLRKLLAAPLPMC